MIDLVAFMSILIMVTLSGLYASSKIQTQSSYLFADRSSSTFKLTSTLVMTELNPATLIGFAGLGYLAKTQALSLPLIFLIGLLFYAITVAKKWKNLDATSVTELFAKRYGKPLANLASIILISAMLGFSATYLKSLTMIFQPLFPNLGPAKLSFIFLLLTLLMTLRGGLISIIRTDVVSFLLALVLMPLIFFYSMQKGELQPAEMTLPPKFVISLILLTMFSYILAPWYGQKIFAAKSGKTAFLSCVLSSLFVFLFYGLAIGATLFYHTDALITHEEALPHLINTLLPSGFRGCSYALFFLIASTTLAGVWSAISSMMVVHRERSYRAGLLWSLSAALMTYLLANLLVDQVLNHLILANIPIVALSFALLAGFYWKGVTQFGAILSIIVGISWGIYCFLHYGDEGVYTWYWAIYGIPMIFASGILGSVIRKKVRAIQ